MSLRERFEKETGIRFYSSIGGYNPSFTEWLESLCTSQAEELEKMKDLQANQRAYIVVQGLENEIAELERSIADADEYLYREDELKLLPLNPQRAIDLKINGWVKVALVEIKEEA